MNNTTCQECGEETDVDENRTVGMVLGQLGPVCNDCWSGILQEETMLSEREADVAALKDFEIPHSEIATVLGIEKSTVDEYSSRISEKVRLAQRTYEELSHYAPGSDSDHERGY